MFSSWYGWHEGIRGKGDLRNHAIVNQKTMSLCRFVPHLSFNTFNYIELHTPFLKARTLTESRVSNEGILMA